jgi:pilus assembly protein Flp/PilA
MDHPSEGYALAGREAMNFPRLTGRRSGAPREKGRTSLSRFFDRLRVDSPPTDSLFCTARQRAPEMTKGGESMSFKDLVHYLRARFAVEEGQTMAEYGVVLAVIAVAVVVALGLLSTSISAAFDSVRSKL